HLLQSNRFSGAENIVCQIMSLFQNNEKFEMIYVSPDGPIANILNIRGLSYLPLKKFSRKEIDRAVHELNPDIIHAHDFNASVRASRYKKQIILSHLHNNPLWLPKLDIRTIIYSLCSSRFNSVIGVSNSVKEEFRYKQLIKDKFVLLPNTVNTERIIKMGNEFVEDDIDILYVGRMAEPKNPIGAINVLENVVKKYSKHLRVVMIGEGPLFDEVKMQIQKRNLTDVIELKGFKSNPYKYMKKSKVLLMPSLWEGFGLVSVEAMLLETPVVAYNVGGLKDIIDETNGFLCGSEVELSNSLMKLLNSEELRKKMGENAAISAKKFSNMNRYQGVLEKIYVSAALK
ncbi:TPA: glycosyltransferase, partial [Enterococcus faecium]|nr:glycosyltransferase [Enterococcus faecium]HDL2373095.1 glycosyltransferase [Enterococcus faecium]